MNKERSSNRMSNERLNMLCHAIHVSMDELTSNVDEMSDTQLQILCNDEFALPVLEKAADRLKDVHWRILNMHDWAKHFVKEHTNLHRLQNVKQMNMVDCIYASDGDNYKQKRVNDGGNTHSGTLYYVL